MPSRRQAWSVLVALATGAAAAATDPVASSDARHYADLTIEELMNETITSVSKREEKLSDAPAAVSIITQEELRRSGATMLPEALRRVPGMEVGAANAHEWAVSVRGFNQVYSNKLLVLLDGRAVYSPLFGGVFWDVQQPMFEDVDRIEVIRGPGATIWGANAVNGVVNVVSRSARETQGAFAYAAVGDTLKTAAGVRQGFRVGAHTYARVFAAYQEYDDMPVARGGHNEDGWKGRHAGFRLDDERGDGRRFTWQADGTSAKGDASDDYDVNTLARWTAPVGGAGSLEVQAYYDRIHTQQPIRGEQTTDTFDFSAQHSWLVPEDYDVVWGVGGRLFRGTIRESSPSVFVHHPDFERHLLSAFVQARKQFPARAMALVGGVKIEHNSYTGFEVQPTLRLIYKPAPQHTLWAAVARAVRTPGEVEGADTLGIVLGGPLRGPDGGYYLPAVVGNPDLRSEVLMDYELGGRFQLSPHASLDVAMFFDAYDRLILYGAVDRFQKGQPVGIAEMLWRNLYRARGCGGEAALTVAPNDHWQIGLAYSCVDLRVIDGAAMPLNSTFLRPPRRQASVHVAVNVAAHATADVQLRYVGAMRGTPAYATADVRLAWQLTPALELSLVGQNLLDPRHLEQAPIVLTPSSEVTRAAYVKLTYRR